MKSRAYSLVGLRSQTSLGYVTGLVGLRLLPNPEFDLAAARKWDPVRYYDDPKYYLSKDLVKPYRIGMSCAFCHVGPNPASLLPIQRIRSEPEFECRRAVLLDRPDFRLG